MREFDEALDGLLAREDDPVAEALLAWGVYTAVGTEHKTLVWNTYLDHQP